MDRSSQEQALDQFTATVAAYGPSAAETFGPSFFTGPRFLNQGSGVPWASREKVTIDVKPSETLASVIDRAAEMFGVSVPRQGVRSGPDAKVSEVVAGVAFYKEADDRRYSAPYEWLSVFPCVDDRGELFWRWINEAQYADLLRAFEHDLLPGDPRRVYLWPMVPQGGEVGFGLWPDFLSTLQVFRQVAEGLTLSAGVAQFFEYVGALKGRLGGAGTVPTEVLDNHNAGPNQVSELLRPGGQVTLAELQQFFGLDEGEAFALVSLFGMDVSSDGLVVFTDQPDSRFLSRLLDHAVQSSMGAVRPDAQMLADFARARLEALAAGEDESILKWGEEWHAASMVENPRDQSEFQDAERGGRPLAFRVIALPTDDGLDPVRLERELNEVAAEGFGPYTTLLDQPLSTGGRGSIFIFVRVSET